MTRPRTATGQYVAMDTADRFWAKVVKSGECWLWTGSRTANQDGWAYGSFWLDGRMERAHRVALLLANGELPDASLQVDHLCRTPLCVNPDHLEAVAPGENYRRGVLGYGSRSLCRAGKHEITDPSNVYHRPDGRRQCLGCIRDRDRGRPRDSRARREAGR